MTSRKRVLVPLATGVEELEAIATVDYLRRAGCHVVTASVDAANPITGRNRIRLMADIDLDEALAEWGDDWDLIAVPGGPAVAQLGESETFMALLARRLAGGGLTAAICAAPSLLAKAGLDRSTAITSYPTTKADLSEFERYDDGSAVVVDGSVITSRGPGTATEFALACVQALLGEAAAAAIRAQTVSA